jgi:hypothetical protein
VFFGTTNDHDYLRDPTGNRRFWPIDAEAIDPSKSIFNDLTGDVVGQIWAEAVMRWRLGEPLFLPPEMEKEAEKRREQHLERDPLQGQIEDFLERPIPEDWQKWSLDRRHMFWANGATDKVNLVPRDRVCAVEIWKECFCENRSMSKIEAHRINAILEAMPGWERSSTARFGAGYGRQRSFRNTKTAFEVSTKPSILSTKSPILSTKSEVRMSTMSTKILENVDKNVDT